MPGNAKTAPYRVLILHGAVILCWDLFPLPPRPAGQEAEGALPGVAGRALHHPGDRRAGGAGLRDPSAGPGPGGLAAVAAGSGGRIEGASSGLLLFALEVAREGWTATRLGLLYREVFSAGG